MSKDKNSALKALAKRPKLVKAIQKGTDFHKLKEIGEVSGGFIRMLMAAGVVIKGEDRIVTFAKGVKASSLPEVEEKTQKKAPKEGKKKGGKDKPSKQAQRGSKVTKKGSKVGKEGKGSKAASKAPQSEPEEAPKKGAKKDLPKGKKPKGKVGKHTGDRILEESRHAKLIKPVGDIPANHKIEVEKAEGFWWHEGRRLAQTNLQFV